MVGSVLLMDYLSPTSAHTTKLGITRYIASQLRTPRKQTPSAALSVAHDSYPQGSHHDGGGSSRDR